MDNKSVRKFFERMCSMNRRPTRLKRFMIYCFFHYSSPRQFLISIIMLPEPVRSSSDGHINKNCSSNEKIHPIYIDNMDGGHNSLVLSRKVPSSDFSSHFVVKASSTSSEKIAPTTESNELERRLPNQILNTSVSSCPKVVTHCNASNNSSADADTIQFTTPVVENDHRPFTSPPLKLTSISSIDSPSHSSEPQQVDRPLTATAYPFSSGTRRSNSFMQHPFMKSPSSQATTSSSFGRMLGPSSRATLLSFTFPDSPMDFSYQAVSPFCLRKNKMGDYEKDNNDKNPTSSTGKANIIDRDYDNILRVCGQRAPIPIDMIFNGVKDVEKIGEGVYGEVYSANFRYFSQCSWVYKVVAIAGDAIVNGENQKGFFEVIPEIVVSQELSKLKGVVKKCYTDGYAYLKNARVAKGAYPQTLLEPWDKFHEKLESDNDRPDSFSSDQLYMVLEFEYAGQDIESLNFRDARQTLSIVLQVAHILAVGESALEFEHRDLHWGNILVQTWQSPTVRYVIQGEAFHVPSISVKAAVIDFTISRLKHSKTQSVIYLDLQDDEEQFLGMGDHQFDIYRMMRDHNRNNWEAYSPKSNIFWLHYLANKLYVKGQYTTCSSGGGRSINRKTVNHTRAIRKLREISHIILHYESANDFIRSEKCKSYREFLGQLVPTTASTSSSQSAEATSKYPSSAPET